MRHFPITLVTVVLIVMTLSAGISTAADEVPGDPQQGLEKVEAVVYGSPGTGGLLLRLSKIERDMFGMELPGSLTERQTALENFVEKGNSVQPSLLFKVAVAEWVTLKRTNSLLPFTERVAELERTLEGETQEGALSARLERLITKLMPNGVSAINVTVPANTVFRAKFVKTLTVRNVSKGDMVALEIDEDCVVGGTLASARGNRLVAEVTKVRMPGRFGIPSEIQLDFQKAEFIDATLGDIFIGPESQKAMDVDAATIGAAGASLFGAVVLGPVGLASGLLVRGSDKQIKEGTIVFVETSAATSIMGYQAAGLTLSTVSDTDSGSPSGGESTTGSFE